MSPDLATDRLADLLGDRLRRDVPLGPMTTYRVGGAASMFVDVRSLDDLVAVAEMRADTGVPVLVVGRGSNMLVADSGFDGVALSIAGFADHIVIPDGDHRDDPSESAQRIVAAGGGVALPVLARRTAAAGITGFEWAVGVPGSVGGAVRMNAGGHGSDMAACLVDVDVFDMDDPGSGLSTRPADELGLRFRASGLAPSQIVVEAR
ncbi:MAG: FAD-binding protein, partial [Ilumatobacter sp.]